MAEVRYPVYGQADVTVDVGGGAHAEAVEAIVKALDASAEPAGAERR
jgi:shikimate kinase